MNPDSSNLLIQKKILEGLGFGFVEEPMASPQGEPGDSPVGRARPARPKSPPKPVAPRQPALPLLKTLPPLEATEARDQLAKLHGEISVCRKCDLSVGRRHAIPGEGPLGAPIYFLAEMPEEQDDLSGLPLQGELGEMFGKIVKAMGYDLGEVYRAFAARCRGMRGRIPRPSEVQACHDWTRREIEIVRPGIIVTLGEIALDSLLPEEAAKGMTRVRGTLTSYRGVPLMPTYGLAYMHRNPAKKKDAWKDLQEVMALAKKDV